MNHIIEDFKLTSDEFIRNNSLPKTINLGKIENGNPLFNNDVINQICKYSEEMDKEGKEV